ncbi:condensation domain-containing protein [Pseudomonas sp. NA13]
MLHADSPLYNIGGYARINGAIDATLLQVSFNQVVNGHDALRIQLVPGSSEHPLPRQRFLGPVDVPLAVHDVSGHADPEASALALLQAKLQTPFSFDDGLLMRADLVKLRENLHYCFVNCHHLIIDGWSFAMIGRAVSQAYTALHDQAQNVATAPTYQAYVEQQAANKDSASFQRQRQYWLEKYRTLPEPARATSPGSIRPAPGAQPEPCLALAPGALQPSWR